MNQTLTSIKFRENETTKFSPLKLIYNRDVLLHGDNILQPRRPYYGDEHHETAFQEQNKALVRMKANVSKAKKKQQEYAKNKSKKIIFEIEEPVYFKNHRRRHKLD